jgi:CRP-like cAMP-binding protein
VPQPGTGAEGGKPVKDELRELGVFSMLKSDELLKIVEMSEEVVFAAGERIIEEGRPTGFLYVVLDGSVVVGKKEKATLRIDKGGLIGELSFVDSGVPSADVWAGEGARLMRVPFDSFRHLVATDRNIAYWIHTSLLNILCRKIRDTSELLFRHGIEPDRVSESRVSYL